MQNQTNLSCIFTDSLFSVSKWNRRRWRWRTFENLANLEPFWRRLLLVRCMENEETTRFVIVRTVIFVLCCALDIYVVSRLKCPLDSRDHMLFAIKHVWNKQTINCNSLPKKIMKRKLLVVFNDHLQRLTWHRYFLVDWYPSLIFQSWFLLELPAKKEAWHVRKRQTLR